MSNETVISSANARIKAMHRFRGQDPTNYTTAVKKRWDAKFGLAGLGNELALNAELDSVGRRVRVKNTSGGALSKGALVALAGAALTAQTSATASNNPAAGTSVTITISGTWEAGQLVKVVSGGYTDYAYIASIGSGFIVVDVLFYSHTTPVVTAEPAYEIALADADGSNAAEWVLPADIADGAYGYAYDCCEVTGLDTSALTAEALVYLSATAGGYTATAPTGSDQIQQVVGIVKSSHASTGSILFIPGLKRILKLGSSCLQSGVGGGVSDGDKGDVTVSSSGTVWTIDNGVVTFAKMANMTTDRLIGRDTAGSGAPEEISVGGGVEFTGSGGIQRSALTGDVTATAGSNTTTIANSVVTFAKFQDISTDKLLGRDTASSGVVEEIGLTGGLEFDGSGNIRIADAGITTTKIVDANITFTKIQNASAASILLGRGSAALGGVFQEITLGSGLTMSGTILSGSGLSDGDKGDVTVTGGGAVWTIDNGVVSLAKMADIATDRLIGRDTAGTGAPEALTVGGGVEFTGSGGIQRSALTGDVTASAGSNATTAASAMITGKTAETTVADDDLLLISDTSESAALNKMTRANLLGSLLATFTNGIVNGTVRFYCQDATPSSPATDDLWYETDTNILWFYDGTRWLSDQLFEWNNYYANITGTTDIYLPIEIDDGIQHDIYLESICGSVYQSNALYGTATHYWKVAVTFLTAGLSGGEIANFTTQNDTIENFNVNKTAINSAYDLSSTGYKVVLIRASIAAGTPGALLGGVAVTYRWVHL